MTMYGEILERARSLPEPYRSAAWMNADDAARDMADFPEHIEAIIRDFEQAVAEWERRASVQEG